MSEFLDSNIMYLQGVGPKRAELLQSGLGIVTFRDLLYFFPYKYLDRTKFYKIGELTHDLPYVQIRGKIRGYSYEGEGRTQRLNATFYDETGAIRLVWFKGTKWVVNNYPIEKEYVVYCKPTIFNGQLNLVHPEIEAVEHSSQKIDAIMQGRYSIPEKVKDRFITSKVIVKMLTLLLTNPAFTIAETLPEYIVDRYHLMGLKEALFTVHFPTHAEALNRAIYRLKFEELLYIQLNILRYKSNRIVKNRGILFRNVGEKFNEFYYNHLPFSLTDAQKRVIREIRGDLGSGRQMNRLLQGDVGSGKTMVALMSMLIAIDNGYQACLMAPTEILANQHYNTISRLLDGMAINVKLLTGSSKHSLRREIAKSLEDSSINIIIGTHALIEDSVVFGNLGLAIIDEQHRFGVEQRARLWKKNINPPHVLVMTATPIPRTLALTLYGDLDVSVIDQLPPGRKPIKTVHYYESQLLSLFAFIREQIAKGRQIYVVYPMIKESEKMDYKNLEQGWELFSEHFPLPQYKIGIAHGKMPIAVREESMRRFKNGELQILIATTVIEVGVDVPNASVMVIESAERFGLSQLHQLRGRVGRGASQSFCILMSSVKLSREARERLNVMVATNDGFEIAETDMRLRGPGDIEGTIQSGMPFDMKIANLARDGQILEYARRVAEDIIEADPLLTDSKNEILLANLKRLFAKEYDWREIG